jgi:putative MATE family efflux protein
MKLSKKSDRLGKEPIVPLLFKLSIPSIIAMVIQALYNVVDSIYIGHVSTDALSALSLCFPIQMIIIGIAVGTGVGTSSLISRLLGKGNKNRASNAAEHVMIVTVIYGITMAVVGFFFSDNLLHMFTNDPKLIEMGTDYISIILIGSIAMFFPMISNNILRGEGNTITPMIAMLIGSILNIILDPFFIFGYSFFPAWGIKGAAFATVFSRIISGIFLFFILISDKNELKLDFSDFNFDFSIIKSIYQVGFPAMVMQFMASFMLGGMNIILASFSSTAIAAAGIYFRLQSFVFMPVFGLNQGYMPLVGYNYGHQKPERMKKAIKAAFVIAFTFTTAGFVLFQLMPTQLIKLFNSDPELIKIGTTTLKTISLAFPIIGPAIIISTTFQAIGMGLPSLLQSFFRQIVVLLPLMYCLGAKFGLSTLWYAFPISETANIIIASIWLIYTLKKVFRKMDKIKEENFAVE